jgi:threonine dehydratase
MIIHSAWTKEKNSPTPQLTEEKGAPLMAKEVLIPLKQIKEARERIAAAITRTPCVYSLPLSRKTGKDVFLKLECLQVTQAFKARGNANKLALMSHEEREKGVITASSGNHGLGLSLAAKRHGVNSVIVVPEVAPANKIEKIKENGAEVIIKGKTYDDAVTYAHTLSEEKGLVYISSFDDPDIIAGNGSVGLEILEDVPDVKLIICPIGGGGGISGISLAVKQINPDIHVVGVEAEKAPSMLRSIEAGEITELTSASTFADGIAVRKPGKLNFEIVQSWVDKILIVSEEEMEKAVVILAKEAKIVAEGAGAASVAALLTGMVNSEFDKIVCIISGGNIDLHLFKRILEKSFSR